MTDVAETTEQAAETKRDLLAMSDGYRQQIAALGGFAPSALRVLDFMQARSLVTIIALGAWPCQQDRTCCHSGAMLSNVSRGDGPEPS